MKKLLTPIVVLVLPVVLFSQGEDRVAQQVRIARQGATVNGDRGLFTVPGVDTLPRGTFSITAGWNNTDRTPRDLDINSFPLSFSTGLTSRLSVSATFETQKQVTARNLAQRGFFNLLPFVRNRYEKGLGDTTISAKYRIQRRSDGVGGIALRGFVKIPTADEALGLGSGEVDGGLEASFSSVLPGRFVMHSMFGLLATRDATVPFRVGIKDELRSGFGAAWPSTGINIGAASIQGMVEYATTTFIGAGTLNNVIQNPSDLAGGVRVMFLNAGLTFDAGYRDNLNFDDSFPGNREKRGWVFSVSFTTPTTAPSGRNSAPVVILEGPEEAIRPGTAARITASSIDVDNDTLTYAWSASGGRITGSGAEVQFETTGLAPGTYKIRAVVTDGKGGSTTAELDITVQ